MPPIRTQSSRNLVEQEGRILLAIQAIQKQGIGAVRVAARVFDVPESTLRTRLKGSTNRAVTRANSHKLTEIEEESLKKWIYGLSWSNPSAFYCTKNGEFTTRGAWIYPEYFGRSKLGYEFREKASGAIESLFKAI